MHKSIAPLTCGLPRRWRVLSEMRGDQIRQATNPLGRQPKRFLGWVQMGRTCFSSPYIFEEKDPVVCDRGGRVGLPSALVPSSPQFRRVWTVLSRPASHSPPCHLPPRGAGGGGRAVGPGGLLCLGLLDCSIQVPGLEAGMRVD